MSDWQTVLGFEVHVELATNSKMFCGCPADHFGKTPNTQTCPVCLGLPGALPVPNAKAIEWCVKLGLALGCKVNLFSKFDRKNYFYPDLSKAYQISQYDLPFCSEGKVELSNGRTIRITRVHMEEDTGKLQHATVDGEKVTLVDFNRSGVPLVEIVTEPDFDNPEDGTEFLKEIQQIVRTLGISSADMEKGSMRLEANISVRPVGETILPPYKVEVKNVNSFRFIKKAIEYEVSRQIKVREAGNIPLQETRGFSESRGETVSQRTKENANDYRYFPEPDIPPVQLTEDQVKRWKSQLPKLPSEVRSELKSVYQLSLHNISVISQDNALYKLFTETAQMNSIPAKTIADFLVNKKYGNTLPESPDQLIGLIQSSTKSTPVDMGEIEKIVKDIISTNEKAVADLKSGKTQSLFFLVGQVKRQLKDAPVETVKELIEKYSR